jgi:hypothetical protein
MVRRTFLLASMLLVQPAWAQPEPTRAPVQPSWHASALKFVPPGYVAGHVVRADDKVGVVPIFRVGSDDPRSPASAFERWQVLAVDLKDGIAVSATLRPREAGDADPTRPAPEADTARQFEEMNAKVEAHGRDLPSGTVPCDLGGYSIDPDPKGLNVRAEPSAQARVLGTLPPRFKIRGGGEAAPPEGYATEFKIIGFKEGWFLIEGAQPPGKEYESTRGYPKNAPKPYPGRGWVAGNKVGANFANGQTRMGGLFQAPHADAPWTRVVDRHGNEIGADSSPDRILACSGIWALVEKNGKRGWWRSLCSNQVTNCS